MTGLERIMLTVARAWRPTAAEVEDHTNVEAETLYMLRLAAIDAEEKRFRQVQRDGRRAIKLGCE
jgi:hypothetical protein